MVDLDSAVSLSGRGARDLLCEIKNGTLHSSQTRTGYLLICLASLRRFAAEDGQGGRKLL